MSSVGVVWKRRPVSGQAIHLQACGISLCVPCGGPRNSGQGSALCLRPGFRRGVAGHAAMLLGRRLALGGLQTPRIRARDGSVREGAMTIPSAPGCPIISLHGASLLGVIAVPLPPVGHRCEKIWRNRRDVYLWHVLTSMDGAGLRPGSNGRRRKRRALVPASSTVQAWHNRRCEFGVIAFALSKVRSLPPGSHAPGIPHVF